MKRDSMLTEEAQNTDFGFAMAYWISPYNQVMAVNNFHIEHIFSNPEKYDMTRQELEDVYRKYDEKIPGEGKAREEIIKSLLKRGWIRIRKYRIKSGEYWSITIDRLTNRINDSITDWCNQMVTRLKVNINDEIKIRGVGEGSTDYIDIDMDGVMKLHLFRYLQESKDKKVSSYKEYIKKCLTEELPSASAPRLNKLIEKNEKETKSIVKKSMTEIIIELQEQELLTEKRTLNRALQIILGLVPTIVTFGIITAENPMAQPTSPEENKRRNENMKDKLHSMRLGFRQQTGKYGNIEKPFLIPNIRKSELIELAIEFGQESVIFGEVPKFGESVYEYIETKDNKNIETLKPEDYKVATETKIYYRKEGAGDFYTEIKGKKFSFPFFDEGGQQIVFKDGYLYDPIEGKKVVYVPKPTEKDPNAWGIKYIPESSEYRTLDEMIVSIKCTLRDDLPMKSRWFRRASIYLHKDELYFGEE